MPGMSETELILLAKQGDQQAKLAIIKKYEGLIRVIAGRFQRITGSKFVSSDFLQEGRLGVLRAIKYLKINRATNLKSYIGRCIQSQIARAASLRYHKGIRIPISQIRNMIGRTKPIKRSYIKDALRAQQIESLVHDVCGAEDKEVNIPLAEFLLSLHITELDILLLRYAESKTHTEIGQWLGLSKQRVQQIEGAALKKLRGAVDDYLS